MEQILFYSEREFPYGIFSNFYPAKIQWNNIVYANSEIMFQCEKFRGKNSSPMDLEYAQLIEIQKSPMKAACLARQTKSTRFNASWEKHVNLLIDSYQVKGVKKREDWEDIKDHVMRRCVFEKFSQNPNLLEILIETQDKILIEHTSRDSYWADGGSTWIPHYLMNKDTKELNQGQNMLGRILMETRFLLNPNISDQLEFPKSGFKIEPYQNPHLEQDGTKVQKEYTLLKYPIFPEFLSIVVPSKLFQQAINLDNLTIDVDNILNKYRKYIQDVILAIGKHDVVIINPSNVGDLDISYIEIFSLLILLFGYLYGKTYDETEKIVYRVLRITNLTNLPKIPEEFYLALKKELQSLIRPYQNFFF